MGTHLAPFAETFNDVVEACRSNVQSGLTSDEVRLRLAKYGENRLAQAAPRPWWLDFVAQFNQLVIWILLVAAFMAGFLSDWTDTVAILAIVLLNGLLGFFQEQRAARALESLRLLASPTSRVIREGELVVVPGTNLVPGDIVLLEAGDSVPADARLIESFAFTVQESALTGESLPVEKRAGDVLQEATPLADRNNMVYLGTTVASGKGKGLVTATGMQSELGTIAGLMQHSEHEPTPLQRRLAELGKILVAGCLSIVAVIFVLEWIRGRSLIETLLLAVSLGVAAVPEGLPAVVTVSLALGLRRMVQRNALVRKLPSVETLGSVTVICTDKTGTLTRNEMTVRELAVGLARFQVSGAGYAPHGTFVRLQSDPILSNGADANDLEVALEKDVHLALTIGARCNNARVKPRGGVAQSWEVVGDPTEGALIVAALKHGVPAETPDLHLLYEIPFDSERKIMSVVLRRPDGTHVLYSKGAPEVVLGKCEFEHVAGQVVPLTRQRREALLQQNAEMASHALRVLGLAYRDDPGPIDQSDLEQNLVFSGLAGMIDPPREEVKDAVAKCRRAGIRAVMITGDHPATALAIARELQIADASHDLVVTGRELDALNDDELTRGVEPISVYARVSAQHKLRIVQAWKRSGQVVAMTGDGVNDAPAIQTADIGIAMGLTGTDVTKAASDMVLMDDNFASIVNAVEEGRGIFDNIQKFVHFLLACNAGEVLVMLFAALVGWPAPLRPIQLLWINLITDGLPALALAMEPPEPDIMRRPPRPPHESVITPRRGLLILFHGVLIAAAAITAFALTYQNSTANLDDARTAAFCVIAFAQLAFAFGCRSQIYTWPQLGFLSNPSLFLATMISGLLQLGVVLLPATRPFFEATPYLFHAGLLVAGLSLAPVTIVELAKLFLIQFTRRPQMHVH